MLQNRVKVKLWGILVQLELHKLIQVVLRYFDFHQDRGRGS